MNFAKRVFLIAGVYGLINLLPQYFMEAKLGRDYPPPVTHPELFYGFIGVAVAWQVLFLIIACDPSRYRLVMLPSILEKVGFGVATVVLYLLGRIALVVFMFGIIDLVLAALFFEAFRRTPAVEKKEVTGR